MSFKTKKLKNQLQVGEILKQAREKSGLSLSYFAKNLKINQKYLEAIEEGDFETLPGEFYVKTFIKKYAEGLGVRWSKIKNSLNQEIYLYNKWQKKKNYKEKINKKNLIVLPNILRRTIVITVIILLLGYLSFQVWQITAPPELKILNPKEITTNHNSNIFVVIGQTETGATVLVNSQEVSPDETGYFNIETNLSAGKNIIKIQARSRYSRTAQEIREIIVENQ